MKLFYAAIICIALFFSYQKIPDSYKYEISDRFGRFTAPNFTLPLDSITLREQASLIGEFKRRGYELKCYGNLRPEEQITAADDFECWALIKSAYDNIPAKTVTFYFAREKLSHVRLEFPELSFGKLKSYLDRRLANYQRLDRVPGDHIGTDIFGKPLMAWKVKGGVVVTSEPTPEQPTILLWSRNYTNF